METDQASILIVEDKPALVSVLEPVLMEAGYVVTIATSLTEAHDRVLIAQLDVEDSSTLNRCKLS